MAGGRQSCPTTWCRRVVDGSGTAPARKRLTNVMEEMEVMESVAAPELVRKQPVRLLSMCWRKRAQRLPRRWWRSRSCADL